MPSIAAFPSFACIMSFTPGPNNTYGAFQRECVRAPTGAPFLPRRPAGRSGAHDGMCAVWRGVVPVFARRGTHNACRRRGVYPLDGLWRLAVGIRKRRFPPCTGQRRRFRDAAAIRQPKGILYGITAFSSFVLPYYDSFMALAVSIGVLSAVAYAGTCFWALLEHVSPPFPPEPPYRRQREHGAPAGVVCRFPVYLIISHGCNPLPRPWAHRVIFKDTVLCPIKRTGLRFQPGPATI